MYLLLLQLIGLIEQKIVLKFVHMHIFSRV